MTEPTDFYEEDEPVDAVREAFDRALREGRVTFTAPPLPDARTARSKVLRFHLERTLEGVVWRVESPDAPDLNATASELAVVRAAALRFMGVTDRSEIREELIDGETQERAVVALAIS